MSSVTTEGCVELKQWCIKLKLGEAVYNKLVEQEFKDPIELTQLKDFELTEMMVECGFKFGTKARLRTAVQFLIDSQTQSATGSELFIPGKIETLAEECGGVVEEVIDASAGDSKSPESDAKAKFSEDPLLNGTPNDTRVLDVDFLAKRLTEIAFLKKRNKRLELVIHKLSSQDLTKQGIEQVIFRMRVDEMNDFEEYRKQLEE